MSDRSLDLRRVLDAVPDGIVVVDRAARVILVNAEACRILGLDTRKVCRLYNEGSTNALLRSIDPRLSFTRNYDGLRPRAASCEEIIRLSDD